MFTDKDGITLALRGLDAKSLRSVTGLIMDAQKYIGGLVADGKFDKEEILAVAMGITAQASRIAGVSREDALAIFDNMLGDIGMAADKTDQKRNKDNFMSRIEKNRSKKND